jgi:2-iminobutanoate/2-iminopropanoate deaminase
VGPYSQAVMTAGDRYLYVSGQIGIDAETGGFVADDAGPQTRRCLENLLAIVRSAGGDESSVVKTTVYLRRVEDFGVMNEVYSGFFEPPYPARSCAAVAELPKGALIEIDAVAVLGG